MPVKIGEIPEPQFTLMRTLKLYERLAAEAIINRSVQTAKRALMVHPLVNSYTLAAHLVEDYIAAHVKYVGEWH
jgi:6-phospho-beta-glucosidase